MDETSPHEAPAQSMTRLVQVILLDAPSYCDGIDSIRDKLLDGKIQPYFKKLLAERGITSSEAVEQANLDKDYGRQILTGKRMARRDTYIQLAFAMGFPIRRPKACSIFWAWGPSMPCGSQGEHRLSAAKRRTYRKKPGRIHTPGLRRTFPFVWRTRGSRRRVCSRSGTGIAP